MNHFVLRIRDADGTFSVGVIELPTTTKLEFATAFAIHQLEDGQTLEHITNAETGESASFGFAASNCPT